MRATFDLILRGGEVVSHAGRGLADIGVRDGRVVRVGDLGQASATAGRCARPRGHARGPRQPAARTDQGRAGWGRIAPRWCELGRAGGRGRPGSNASPPPSPAPARQPAAPPPPPAVPPSAAGGRRALRGSPSESPADPSRFPPCEPASARADRRHRRCGAPVRGPGMTSLAQRWRDSGPKRRHAAHRRSRKPEKSCRRRSITGDAQRRRWAFRSVPRRAVVGPARDVGAAGPPARHGCRGNRLHSKNGDTKESRGKE